MADLHVGDPRERQQRLRSGRRQRGSSGPRPCASADSQYPISMPSAASVRVGVRTGATDDPAVLEDPVHGRRHRRGGPAPSR